MLRSLTQADCAAWQQLAQAIHDAHAHSAPFSPQASLDAFHGSVDCSGTQLMGTFSESGTLVGYFRLRPGRRSELLGAGGVHPDHPGRATGSLLMTAMLEQARRTAGGATRIRVSADPADRMWTDAVLARGFAADGGAITMEHTLRGLPSMPPPEGFSIAPLDPAHQPQVMLALHNEVFADVPGAHHWSAADWQEQMLAKPQLRPDLSFTISHGDRPVGYLHAEEWPGERREVWIARVGTRREYRQRGVAGALLSHFLSACARAGFEVAGLAVALGNPSRPENLYTSLGFHVESRAFDYVLPLR